jgi:hypothetical protein
MLHANLESPGQAGASGFPEPYGSLCAIWEPHGTDSLSTPFDTDNSGERYGVKENRFRFSRGPHRINESEQGSG